MNDPIVYLTQQAFVPGRITAAPKPPPRDDDEGGRPRPAERRRSVAGQLVPYGVIGHPAGPFDAVRFARGAVQVPADSSRVKLLRDHDARQPIGVLDAARQEPAALVGEFTVGRHAAASEALAMAQDRVLDGLSVGVRVTESSAVKVDGRDVEEVTAGELVEVSLVAIAAYPSAQITQVAAQERQIMTETTAKAPPAETTAKAPPAETTAKGDELRTLIHEVLDERAPVQAADTPGPGFAGAQTQTRAHVNEPNHLQDTAASMLPRTADGRTVTAGMYALAYAKANRDADATELRAMQDAVVRAAATDQGLPKVPGLLPQQITGPMLGKLEPRRPVFNSLTLRPMPGPSAEFERPRIKTHTHPEGVHAEFEKAADSGPLEVILEKVKKTVYAKTINVSHEVMDWSSPAVLDMLLEDWAVQYVLGVEKIVSADFPKVVTQTSALAKLTPDALNTALYQAAATIYNGPTQNLPNTLWMSPDVWALVGSLADTTTRPIFPYLSPTNASGTVNIPSISGGGNIEGVKIVVGPQLPAKTLIVGDSLGYEVYEDRRGLLRVEMPATIAVQLATYSYLAQYGASPGAFVKITLPAPATGKGTSAGPAGPPADAADEVEHKDTGKTSKGK